MKIIQLHVTTHKTAKAIGINIDSINTLSTVVNTSVIFIIALGASTYTTLTGPFDGVCEEDGVAVTEPVDVLVAKLLYELKGESVKYDDIVAELVAVETS